MGEDKSWIGKIIEWHRIQDKEISLNKKDSLGNPFMIFFSQVRQRAALQLVGLDTAETFRWDIDINWEKDILYIRAGLQIS